MRRRAARGWDETTAGHINSRLRSYYTRLKSADETGLENADAQLRTIAEKAWQDIAADLGKSAYPDEAWRVGYLERYRANMVDKLCTANYEQLHKALEKNVPKEEIPKLMASVVGQWRRGEYSTSARGENMARTEAAWMRNEALVAGYRQAGYYTNWRSAPGCCRICTELNGQRVTTLKPPLHKGCLCTVVRGEKNDLPGKTDTGIIDALGRPTQKTVNGFKVEIMYGHQNVKPIYKPNAVIDVVGDSGGTMRYVYDKSGKIRGHIDNNDHGYPKWHPFKNHEHMHKAKWIEEKFAGFEPAEELTEYQRKMNADILKEE